MRYGRWNIAGYDREVGKNLFRNGINPLLALVMASRNVCAVEEANKLIADDMSKLADPFILADMQKAVDRIMLAINSGEHIAVYGDYDVDGITSSCFLASFFREKGLECDIYIPERLEEGYGVKIGGIKSLYEKGVTLIITVDCGVTALEETDFANSLGIDMVITDHHECGEKLPNAVAVIDPKRGDSVYPEKSLAGVGVAFKLVCAIEKDTDISILLRKYSDLVAVGTVADVVPVTGENRIFIRHGLDAIKKGGRIGIKKLCTASGIDNRQITSGNIGFTLAPRINAAGRLGCTKCAQQLLLTDDEREAEELAQELCALNRSRQQLEGEIFSEALSMLEKEPPNGKMIVLAKEGWHQGVAGIVASKVSEKYCLPTIIICLQNGVGRGSCRSFGGFNLFEALDKNSGFLEAFGGHEMAAGLTILSDKVAPFRESMGQYYRDNAAADTVSVLNIDFQIAKAEILTIENVQALSALEPFGNGNPTPVMSIADAEVTAVIPICGGKHTKIWITKDGSFFEGVFFSRSAEELKVKDGGRIDLAFIPQINEFRGKRSVQLNLLDVRVK